MKIIKSRIIRAVLCIDAVLVLLIIALMLCLHYQHIDDMKNFAGMFPTTNSYLQKEYGHYFSDSQIHIHGSVRIVFSIDEDFLNSRGYIEEQIEDSLSAETNKIYALLTEDGTKDSGKTWYPDAVFLTYRYHDTYYNFAYHRPMIKSDEVYYFTV